VEGWLPPWATRTVGLSAALHGALLAPVLGTDVSELERCEDVNFLATAQWFPEAGATYCRVCRELYVVEGLRRFGTENIPLEEFNDDDLALLVKAHARHSGRIHFEGCAKDAGNRSGLSACLYFYVDHPVLFSMTVQDILLGSDQLDESLFELAGHVRLVMLSLGRRGMMVLPNIGRLIMWVAPNEVAAVGSETVFLAPGECLYDEELANVGGRLAQAGYDSLCTGTLRSNRRRPDPPSRAPPPLPVSRTALPPCPFAAAPRSEVADGAVRPTTTGSLVVVPTSAAMNGLASWSLVAPSTDSSFVLPPTESSYTVGSSVMIPPSTRSVGSSFVMPRTERSVNIPPTVAEADAGTESPGRLEEEAQGVDSQALVPVRPDASAEVPVLLFHHTVDLDASSVLRSAGLVPPRTVTSPFRGRFYPMCHFLPHGDGRRVGNVDWLDEYRVMMPNDETNPDPAPFARELDGYWDALFPIVGRTCGERLTRSYTAVQHDLVAGLVPKAYAIRPDEIGEGHPCDLSGRVLSVSGTLVANDNPYSWPWTLSATDLLRWALDGRIPVLSVCLFTRYGSVSSDCTNEAGLLFCCRRHAEQSIVLLQQLAVHRPFRSGSVLFVTRHKRSWSLDVGRDFLTGRQQLVGLSPAEMATTWVYRHLFVQGRSSAADPRQRTVDSYDSGRIHSWRWVSDSAGQQAYHGGARYRSLNSIFRDYGDPFDAIMAVRRGEGRMTARDEDEEAGFMRRGAMW
ncbi:hypothetical protein FOL46_001923, partial [Perkinsus olseni]